MEDLVLVYVGSKSRLSKQIVPIIQEYANKTETYIEPFVGGANVIDKINCPNKIGSDINKYLIALLKKAQQDIDEIPDWVSKDEYYSVKKNPDLYEDWYVGLVSILCSFKAKVWGGYSGNVGERNYVKEKIANLKKQAIKLAGIDFICTDYHKYTHTVGATIYCDPPYRDTLGYGLDFDHEVFLDWCKQVAKNNYLLLSERFCPDGFEILLETKTRNSILFADEQKKFIDLLCICK